MKIKVGDVLEIGGENGTVCYETNYNDTNYICVAFTDNKIKYELYKYKYEGSKLMVAKLVDTEEATEVTKIFLDECIDENGFPEQLNKIMDYLDKKKDNDN